MSAGDHKVQLCLQVFTKYHYVHKCVAALVYNQS